MSETQHEINACIKAFVADLTEMAHQAVYDALSQAIEEANESGATEISPRSPAAARRASSSRGGKRSQEELDTMAEFFEVYVNQAPGQRMEEISKALGYRASELNLPVKKLLAAGKIRMEGQKRATRYYPVKGRGRGRGRGRKN